MTADSGVIVVTFDRVGRERALLPLVIHFPDVALIESGEADAQWPGDLTNWQAVLDRIEEHTRPFLGVDRVDVHLFGNLDRLHGHLVANDEGVGTFTIDHPDQEIAA